MSGFFQIEHSKSSWESRISKASTIHRGRSKFLTQQQRLRENRRWPFPQYTSVPDESEIPRFPQVILYIYIYIRMFFPHGSLPRRAETYATLLETRKLPPLRHANGERRRNFRRVSIPNSIGDGRCSWYIIRDSFSRDVTWTLCNFSLPSFPPWRSNLRAQVVRGGQIRIFCAIPYHYILLPTHGVINNQDFIEFRTI